VARGDIDILLGWLPDASAARAAHWVVWSVIVRRWTLALASVVVSVRLLVGA
jgi:hypothetical protein